MDEDHQRRVQPYSLNIHSVNKLKPKTWQCPSTPILYACITRSNVSVFLITDSYFCLFFLNHQFACRPHFPSFGLLCYFLTGENVCCHTAFVIETPGLKTDEPLSLHNFPPKVCAVNRRKKIAIYAPWSWEPLFFFSFAEYLQINTRKSFSM